MTHKSGYRSAADKHYMCDVEVLMICLVLLSVLKRKLWFWYWYQMIPNESSDVRLSLDSSCFLLLSVLNITASPGWLRWFHFTSWSSETFCNVTCIMDNDVGTVGFHKDSYEKTWSVVLTNFTKEKENKRELEAARRLISSSQEELLISNEKRSVYC